MTPTDVLIRRIEELRPRRLHRLRRGLHARGDGGRMTGFKIGAVVGWTVAAYVEAVRMAEEEG